MAGASTRRHRGAGRFSGWRLVVASVALVAFALQSYIVQTHIHFAPDVEARLAGVHGTASHHHDRYPANEDPANCPICQELLHSGTFVAPAPEIFLPPFVPVSAVVAAATALPIVIAPSHSWQGRAPPLL